MESHVREIKDSIEKTCTIGGSIILAYTRLLNSDPKDKQKYWYIIDGQHRWRAIEQLAEDYGEEIYDLVTFESVPDDWSYEQIVDCISSLNQCSKNWSNKNYMKVYMDSPAYRQIDSLEKETRLSISNLLTILYPTVYRKIAMKAFREGRLQVSTNSRAIETARFIAEYREAQKNADQRGTGFDELVKIVAEKIYLNPNIDLNARKKKSRDVRSIRERLIDDLIKKYPTYSFIKDSELRRNSIRKVFEFYGFIK